jgi:hypothetical protein
LDYRLKAIVFITAMIALTAPTAGCQGPAADKPGRLNLASEPGDQAEVFIDGRRQEEETNAVFTLDPGSYQIKLVRPGSQTSDDDMEGQAVVEIRPGRTTRALVRLSRMRVVPTAGRAAVEVDGQAQKAALDYFTALAAGDSQKAFAYLSRQSQASEGGYQRYARRWRLVDQVQLIGLVPEPAESERGALTSRIKLRLTVKAAGTEPGFEGEVELVVVVAEEAPGLGLLKIDSIVDQPELPFPPQLRP